MSKANGTALTAWMEANDVKVASLCNVLGVSRSTVYAWRAGSPPRRQNAATLAKLTSGAVAADAWD